MKKLLVSSIGLNSSCTDFHKPSSDITISCKMVGLRRDHIFFEPAWDQIATNEISERGRFCTKSSLELCGESPPVIVESIFYDDDLRRSQADLLVKVEMTSSEPGFFYVLVEHKSYQDPAVVLQMMGYSAHTWRNFIWKGKKPAKRTTRARALRHAL